MYFEWISKLVKLIPTNLLRFLKTVHVQTLQAPQELL